MTAEQKFVLRCLSDYINKKDSIVNVSLNFDVVTQIARQHQIEAIIYYQCKNSVDFISLKDSIAAAAYYSKTRDRVLDKVNKEFSNNKIDYLIFKGPEISCYYPNSLFRSMGDVDILVKENQKEKAHNILVHCGFNPVNLTDCEWCYKKGKLEFELHHTLVYDRLVSMDQHKLFFDKVWEHAHLRSGTQYSLELEYHIIYLLVHLRKHMLNCGAGIRQFLDLAVISLYGNIDWLQVQRYLEEIGLLQFAINCFSLCGYWFGVKVCLCQDINEQFVEIATKEILANGVFGFDNESNSVNVVSNQLNSGKRKLSIITERMFPSYRVMCSCDDYSFVKGKPFLLPISWVYRFYLSIKSKKAKNAFRDAVSVYTQSTVINDRVAYLKQWGL